MRIDWIPLKGLERRSSGKLSVARAVLDLACRGALLGYIVLSACMSEGTAVRLRQEDERGVIVNRVKPSGRLWSLATVFVLIFSGLGVVCVGGGHTPSRVRLEMFIEPTR